MIERSELTSINSKVKIHVVDELFVGEDYATEVWVFEVVRDKLDQLGRTNAGRRFFEKIEYYAKQGFGDFTGGKGCPIQPEWEGTFRVSHSKSSLFRIIGFFDGPGNGVFIAMDAFTKRGQGLSNAQRKRIDAVAKVKSGHNWELTGS